MPNYPSSPAALPDFTPVPRQTVSHGWTAAKQRDFIAGLAQTGSVRLATEACGMSHTGVYKLHTAKDGGSFARAWDIAVGMGAARIRDVLFDHAIHGVPETVIIGKKTRIERRRFNHRTMIWALQHHMPDQYPGGGKLPAGPQAWNAEPEMSDEERKEQFMALLFDAENSHLREVARDPAKRAAYEVLNPNETHDWDAIAAGGYSHSSPA